METCSVCGEAATDSCPRLHREWCIILPGQLQADDVLLRPDGRIYQVVSFVQNGDEFIVQTGQRRQFLILYQELPILVRRLRACGWARCELHCGKCARYATDEDRRERLLQSANAVKSQTVSDRPEERQKQKKKHKT